MNLRTQLIFRCAFVTAILWIGLCGSAVGGVIGTFQISGSTTLRPTSITWTSLLAVANETTVAPSGLTGIYSGIGLGGHDVAIEDLTTATEPVGVMFPAQTFISFTGFPALSALEDTFITPGIYTSAGCTANPPSVGQTCTPSFGGSVSPFNFVNNPPPPPSGPFSAVTWVVSGVSADGQDTWVGVFVSQFTEPFQNVLAALGPGGPGFISNTYSATITVSSAATSLPEPDTMALLFAGLMSLAVFVGRSSRRF